MIAAIFLTQRKICAHNRRQALICQSKKRQSGIDLSKNTFNTKGYLLTFYYLFTLPASLHCNGLKESDLTRVINPTLFNSSPPIGYLR